MTDDLDLGTFLRARRELLQPNDVGLVHHGRRRTPGLRREEVATLAGVSVDYLVRLEQGRDSNPSAEVLASLARALRLSDDERMHLAKLAARGNAPDLCPSLTTAERTVAPTVRTILGRVEPTPAFVLGPFGDVLAWNDAWAAVVEPLHLLAWPEGATANIARYVLTDPIARDVFADWEQAADEQVTRLRAASVRWSGDEHLAELLAHLSPRPEFAGRWARHDVAEKRRGVKTLRHPAAGALHIAYEVMALPDAGEQSLVMWLPADDTTAAAFTVLTGVPLPQAPARLRVVGPA